MKAALPTLEEGQPLASTQGDDRNDRPVIAIIGGGFTGAAVAYRLAQGLKVDARIVIYEPRAIVGAGLAYDTADPVHRINVPATRMSLIPGDEAHFPAWLSATGALADDPDALTPKGHAFARRRDFGRYVAAQLEPLLALGAVEHRRVPVRTVSASGDRWRLIDDTGGQIEADIVVLATSHPAPPAPGFIDQALGGARGYVADATRPGALDAIGPDDRVLVVGTGLTASDVIASLDAAGHRGPIAAISRRGLRSRGHNLDALEPFGDFTTVPITSARKLVREVRAAVRAAADQGLTWHAVFDRLRGEGRQIWSTLPPVERRRLVRFLRPYWDVHRFRIAPQVEAVIERRVGQGTLRFHAASIVDVARPAAGLAAVTFRQRHSRRHFTDVFDAVIVTTGPDHRAILRSQPLLAGLAQAGHLTADAPGLGLAVDGESRAIGSDGRPAETLFIAGPLARGTFGELMGLPQVTEHAIFVAETIGSLLRRQKPADKNILPNSL